MENNAKRLKLGKHDDQKEKDKQETDEIEKEKQITKK